ncbi:MAG: prephenate dehydrogenase/arogenate dehydrogenase family protein, partial [Sphingomonadaceae bacterium]|nr:prephenate dehydrogenase/arogenate dehydrogenase family protein [Sphingomonadaceae bacterium]
MLPFARIAIIGMGLIGSSLARSIRATMPTVRLSVTDADAHVRARVRDLDLADDVADSAGVAVIDADLVILCVPVGAMGRVAGDIAADLAAGVVVSDVGSVKGQVLVELTAALPGIAVIPAHPVAGTEKSGPDAGFASLFAGRWCIVTPPAGAD